MLRAHFRHRTPQVGEDDDPDAAVTIETDAFDVDAFAELMCVAQQGGAAPSDAARPHRAPSAASQLRLRPLLSRTKEEVLAALQPDEVRFILSFFPKFSRGRMDLGYGARAPCGGALRLFPARLARRRQGLRPPRQPRGTCVDTESVLKVERKRFAPTSLHRHRKRSSEDGGHTQ